MCIIAVVPPGMRLELETLETCMVNNSDGFGFAFQLGEKVGIYTTMGEDKFIENYRKAEFIGWHMVHCRISTGGDLTTRNCHPFRVNESLAFAHNGMLDIVVPKGSKDSDTRVFRDTILAGCDIREIKRKAYQRLLADYARGSKLAFLPARGTPLVINRQDGVQVDGIWYSNTSYEDHKYWIPQAASGGFVSASNAVAYSPSSDACLDCLTPFDGTETIDPQEQFCDDCFDSYIAQELPVKKSFGTRVKAAWKGSK